MLQSQAKLPGGVLTRLKDYEIEAWLRSPDEYRDIYVLGKQPTSPNWRQMAQYAVNHILNDCHAIPPKQRSTAAVLQRIYERWKINPGLFQSKVHYVMVLAAVTDQLLKYFAAQPKDTEPLLLFESFTAVIQELQLELSMIFQVAQWTKEGLHIQKIVVNEDPALWNGYVQMMTLFSCNGFGNLPAKIEWIGLLSGKRRVYYPREKDVAGAVDYMEWVRSGMEKTHLNPDYSSEEGHRWDCYMMPSIIQ